MWKEQKLLAPESSGQAPFLRGLRRVCLLGLQLNSASGSARQMDSVHANPLASARSHCPD